MTDNRLLTNDALAAIAARAEAYEKASEAYTEACATTLWLSTPKTRDAEYDARIALDRAEDEFDTHAHADVPRLLAHIRAQDAENARLREALGAVCEACTKIATFEPGGELSFDRWDRGHRAGWRMAGKIAKQALEDTTAARALDGEEGA